jgi:hypothetical protein
MRITLLFLLLAWAPAAHAMTPSFTRGTQTSRTESTTTISEAYEIVEYSTGTSYTMSGTNIQWSGKPRIDAGYSMVLPGAATQFSETVMGPGVTSETNFTRETVIESVTVSTSVFTQ